ncbi:MAG: GNAT family N-acetyltransferase [Clostridia bacterium]|nr:GNAT family N-acetyltransferase [Clostridia bacterium]
MVKKEKENKSHSFKIVSIKDRPELKDAAAQWFHSKWGVPLEAYVKSMDECLSGSSPVPQWYVAMDGDRIIGGLGVIENDFHDRKDLAPNVCAVYTEEDMRCRGIAGALLNYVCEDMAKKGITTLYLLTDHTSFYERYGWEFYCMAQGDGEEEPARMYIHRQ